MIEQIKKFVTFKLCLLTDNTKLILVLYGYFFLEVFHAV